MLTIDEEKIKELPQDFKVYELITVNFLRKYLGLSDILFSLFNYYLFVNWNIFYNFRVASSQKTLVGCCKKIGIFFDRYSYINTLKRIK